MGSILYELNKETVKLIAILSLLIASLMSYFLDKHFLNKAFIQYYSFAQTVFIISKISIESRNDAKSLILGHYLAQTCSWYEEKMCKKTYETATVNFINKL